MRTARAQQPPFKGGDSGGLQEGWGEEVVDYGGDFAGGGGVFGGAEDDPC
jgi:hypothetical protein